MDDKADMRALALDGLRRHFGFERFRSGQAEAIERLLAGQDVLAIMPTGGGKSLCYQLPALLRDGVTVVVSPLIALMKDQVDQLHARGILEATCIHSGLGPGEAAARLRAAREGQFRLLYVAPERFALGSFLPLLEGLRVGLFVVDEAHCVSAWGHDFRPDYMRLGAIVARLRPAPLLALTATAAPKVRGEIVSGLAMESPHVLVNPFDRPNLSLSVVPSAQPEKLELVDRIVSAEAGSVIVYVSRQRDAEQIAAFLKSRGANAVPYHAGMAPAARTRNQEQFLTGKARVIAATVAFGMGIDKPDVRAVVHYQHPGSLESYYQEAGRAGRDGLPSRCVVIHSRRDTGIQHFFIRQRYPQEAQIREVLRLMGEGIEPEELCSAASELSPEQRNVALSVLLLNGHLTQTETGVRLTAAPRTRPSLDLSAMERRKSADYRRLEAMLAYLSATDCRRGVLLRYFGEKWERDRRCTGCDTCTGERPGVRRTVRPKASVMRHDADVTRLHVPQDARVEETILLALKTFADAGLTRSSLAQTLIGSATRAVKRMGHDRHVLFGSLRGYGRKEVVAVLDGLLQCGVGAMPARDASRLRQSAPKDEAPFPPAGEPLGLLPEPDAAEPVPRRAGLAILRLLERWPQGLPRSGVANVLRGALSSDIVRRLGKETFPELGTRREDSYHDLVRYVDLMAAKGYCAVSPRGVASLTARGRSVLAGTPNAPLSRSSSNSAAP